MHLPAVQVFPTEVGQHGCPDWPQGVQVESKEQSVEQIETPLGTVGVEQKMASFGRQVAFGSSLATQIFFEPGGTASQFAQVVQVGGVGYICPHAMSVLHVLFVGMARPRPYAG
jgi:hypothetical protein